MAKRQRMDIADRAKQFMPFAALKGYEEALAEVERRIAEKSTMDDGRDGGMPVGGEELIQEEQNPYG